MIYPTADTEKILLKKSQSMDTLAIKQKYYLPIDNKKTIVFVGRFAPQKRPIEFVKLAEKYPSINFLMIGDGELSIDVDNYKNARNIENLYRIRFVENIAEVFSIVDGMVFTSAYEGLPIAMIEALICGIPVFSTDVGDNKVVINEYKVGVVTPNDTVLQMDFDNFISNLEIYSINAKASASSIADRFSSKTISKQYKIAFNDLIQSYHKPLVSVIIPSYNHALYIEQSIRSVLEQTYQNIELIVVDDGSTDQSVEIIENIKDPRLVLYKQTNYGAHVAINRGLSLAKGEYLTILNSDDIFYSERIETILNFFKSNSDVELVSTYIEVIDSQGKQLAIKKGWENLEPWALPSNDVNYKNTKSYALNLITSNFVSTTSNIVVKQSLYAKIGGMRNLRFAHDWDFLLRASLVAKCEQLEEVLLKYRVHSTNTIVSNKDWLLFEICWIMAVHFVKFGNKIFSDVLNPEILSIDIDRFLGSVYMQNKDKFIWLISIFIDSATKKGIENPEELLLDNAMLRSVFIGKIKQ